MNFANQAIGAGNAAEQVVATNGTIVIPKNRELTIEDFLATYRGAGIIRIRNASLVGAILFELRFAADGSIQGDFKNGLHIEATLTAARTIVITEEGAFANSILLLGVLGTLDPGN